jgi:pyrimidine-specific ribonucleoside hydrolase
VRELTGPAARLVALQAADPAVQAHAGQSLPVWDELAVLWLHDPSLAGSRPLPGREGVRVLAGAAPDAVRAAYLELLAARGEGPPPRAAVLFTRYPTDPGLYRPDVAPLVPRLIARHGYEEFKAALLTNELHRHLGIISILGAKMGIRARELLGADLDALSVRSLAGLEPPLSCLNDGLQTATGASLGRGTIRVSGDQPRAAAEFGDRDGRRLRLSARPEVLARLREDIGRTARTHPGLTPLYFREVRRLALEAWLELDRREIFREEWLAGGPEGR